MDFEHAAQRLKRDQSKLKGRRGKPETSAKAKREAERHKKQQQELAVERQRKKKQQQFIKKYYQKCEVSLGVRQLSRLGNLQLRATSIHGEGDKIALPPSALEYLTNSGNDMASGSPWIFRIGILNPDYNFPASPLLHNLPIPTDDDEEMDLDDDEEEETLAKNAYLDELNHRYISYTHGTVLEFTQDEDHIGLPEPIAAALLGSSTATIPTTRTVDPAKRSTTDVKDGSDIENDVENSMDVENDEEGKTPGHLAWGAFDIPDLPIELVLVKIPKGKACRLTPTPEAIKNGFYNLKDVKMVLEQSLIRTRATLSVGDLVQTWHRGAKFDLNVTEVTPATYNTVTCINTDIEVEFGAADKPVESPKSTGYTLGSSSSAPASSGTTPASASTTAPTLTSLEDLLEEPPAEQRDGVCTAQIRAGGGHGRRRFDVLKATMGDLFAFAMTITGVPADKSKFQLVTRFPRRSFGFNELSTTMQQAGISAGQELFMVEKLEQ